MSCAWAVRLDSPLGGRFGYAGRFALFLYILYSFALLVWVDRADTGAPYFLGVVHLVDVIWPSVIWLIAGGASRWLILLFLFAIASAAWRWHARETLATTAALVLILPLGNLVASSRARSLLAILLELFRTRALVAEVLGVLIVGGLLAYLARGDRGSRSAGATVHSILQSLRPEAGMHESLDQVLHTILAAFGAKRVLLVLRESSTGRAFEWSVRNDGSWAGGLERREVPSSEAANCLSAMPGESGLFAQARTGAPSGLLALDHKGRRVKGAARGITDPPLLGEPFETLMAANLQFGRDWAGRIFLLDARSARRESRLRALQGVAAEVGATLYGVYRLRRLRARTRSVERLRVARDLHDGAIQSMVALEMSVDSLGRQNASGRFSAAEALAAVQRLLRQGIVNLREDMERLRLDPAPRQLRPCLAEMLEKFQRETGITATFACDAENEMIAAPVSREVVRIVHEALANVRKHSGAHTVEVRLDPGQSSCQLLIRDDGRGFGFSGRLSQAELDASHMGPRVIKERVRYLKGELAIESYPNQGARLDIRFASHV
ncbi:MAG: sensor histidine kinase [Terriglobia bacterium]